MIHSTQSPLKGNCCCAIDRIRTLGEATFSLQLKSSETKWWLYVCNYGLSLHCLDFFLKLEPQQCWCIKTFLTLLLWFLKKRQIDGVLYWYAPFSCRQLILFWLWNIISAVVPHLFCILINTHHTVSMIFNMPVQYQIYIDIMCSTNCRHYQRRAG